MTDLSQIDVLINRVEEAESPDRGLDLHIARFIGALGHASGLPDQAFLGASIPPCLWKRYTESFDDAVAFCEKLLPGWHWLCAGDGRAWLNSPHDATSVFNRAETTPIALVAATLTAYRRSAQSKEAA